MDDNAKQVSSYQLDQEILDARGIKMSVCEVATLPTCRYAERVAALRLPDADLAFLKGLRRRIKNRLASQNSRRRSMEHLRRLSRELRAVRARRADAMCARRALIARRDAVSDACRKLRKHVVQVLRSRHDPTEVPSIDIINKTRTESQQKDTIKKLTAKTETQLIPECYEEDALERERHTFECRIDKIVNNSVNHIYKGVANKKIFAKTVFISNKDDATEFNGDLKGVVEESGVLNLSVKQEKRRSHGRKQSAPRRIAYVATDVDNDDDVLDLKIKKEPQ